MKEEYGPFNEPAAGGEGYRDYNILDKIFYNQAGGDVFTDMSFEVHMNLLALIIMFLLRFIVIIPIVNFIEAKKKNDLDYREYFNEDKFS